MSEKYTEEINAAWAKRIGEIAPFLPDPRKFTPVRDAGLQPRCRTTAKERKLFKENGWAWDRNAWIQQST